MASSQMRISGVNSGFDTEAMIQQMMSAYQTKIDKQNQKLQILQWQQEQYRDITSKLTGFKSKYFDILKRDTYLMSPSAFSKFKTTITTKSGKESGLKVTTDTKSTAGSHKIKVDSIATSAVTKGGQVSAGNFKLDVDKAMADATADENGKYNFSLDVKVGNVAKTVEFSGADKDEILASLNTELEDAFGSTSSGKAFISASLDNGALAFSTAGNAMATVTERTGNFGMGKPSAKVAIDPAAALTGTSSISVTVPNYYDKSAVTKNIEFQTVSSTYFDGRDSDENIKAAYLNLKKASYAQKYGVDVNTVTEEMMNDAKFIYSSADAAYDLNKQTMLSALNSAYSLEQGVTFSLNGSSMTAKYMQDGSAVEFTMTSTCDATFGLKKGSATSYLDESTKLFDMGISPNKSAEMKTDYTMPDKFALNVDGALDRKGGSGTFTLEIGVDGNAAKEITFSGTDKASVIQSLNDAIAADSELSATGLKAVEKADGSVNFEMTSGKSLSIKEKDGDFSPATDRIWEDPLNIVSEDRVLKLNVGGVEKTVNIQGLMGPSDPPDPDADKLERDQNKDNILMQLNGYYEGTGVTFTYSATDKLLATKDGVTSEVTDIEVVTPYEVDSGAEYNFPEYTVSEGGYSMTINGKEITVGENATVTDLINAVNKSGAGVTMSYSKLEGAFTLTANDMGNGGDVDVSGPLADALKISDSTRASHTAGTNAIITVDGVQVEHNDNVYEIDGITMDFSDVDPTLGEEISVNVDKSYDDIKQTIKDFVKDYNQMIDDINGYTQTARPKDKNKNYYEPLTDEEKEDMSEDEIKKWEEAAKKGLLYHDTTVSSVMSRIRTAMYSAVELEDGKKFGLYNMGIKTVGYLDEGGAEGAKYGKLKIDEDALDKAFEEHADDIVKLFTDADNGVMAKVNKAIESATKDTSTTKGTLIRKAGLATGTSNKDNLIYKEMERINKRIEQLQERYDKKEEYWWTVFTNLEKMQSQFNSQQSYIEQFTANGGYLS